MIKVGAIYQHSKKQTQYLVLSLATHSETLETMVVYVSLYSNDKSQVWVRPLSMWEELVEVDGKKAPRFSLIAESVIKD